MLDPGFGRKGIVTLGSGTKPGAEIYDSAIGPNGELGVISDSYELDVLKLGPDGRPDRRFGGDGQVQTSPGPVGSRERSVAVMPDASILVAGGTFGTGPCGEAPIVGRYGADGHLVSSFGAGGIARVPLCGVSEFVRTAPAGRVIVVGLRFKPEGPGYDGAFAARLLPNGRPDPSFGRRGVAILPRSFEPKIYAVSNPGVVVVGPSGEVYVAGNSPKLTGPRLVLKLTPKGHPDRSFGRYGVAQLPSSFGDGLLAGDPSGGIFVAQGNFDPSQSLVAKLTPSGVVDPEFGIGGYAHVSHFIFDLAVDGNGRIVAAGASTVSRLMPDGQPDTSFGGTGSVELKNSSLASPQSIYRVLPTTGSRVVLESSSGFTALDADGALDPSFGGASPTGSLLTTRDDRPVGILGLPRGRTLLLTPRGGVARLRRDGSFDRSFGPGGMRKLQRKVGAVPNRYSLGDVLENQGDRLLAMGAPEDSPSVLGVIRLKPHGHVDPSFGDAGLASLTVGELDIRAEKAIALRDGSVAAAATGSEFSPGRRDVFLARYSADGERITGFGGGDGLVRRPLASRSEAIKLIDLDEGAGGTIVVTLQRTVGTQDPVRVDTVVQRYTSDGSLDKSFGRRGSVAFPRFKPRSTVIPPRGNLLIGGVTCQEAYACPHEEDAGTLVSLNQRGRRARGFGGGDGRVRLTAFGGLQTVYAAPGLGIVALGSFDSGLVLARFRADGVVDRAFGHRGRASITAHGHLIDLPYAAIEGKGLVIAGRAELFSGGLQVVVVRVPLK